MAFTKILGPGIHTEADLEVDDINAGIVTAETFIGDASQLTGLPSGLGTALSNDVDSPLNKIYYTNSVLSVGATITINHPSSAVAAYTQYADIVATGDADIIVEDGDDFVPDILGLSTSGPPGVLAGGGGRIRADNISSKSGLGAVSFTNGVNVGGITTVAELHVGVDTGFFTEDLVVNGSARITGIFTVGRDTLIFDGANNSITVGSGVTIDGSSGIITATRFDGDGSNLSGIDATTLKDSEGNIVAQANASGLMLSGITTVTSGKLMVGNAYVDSAAVGIGSTTSSGRDAGIGTMVGSMVYVPDTGLQIYTGSDAGWKSVADTNEVGALTITGGTITTSGNERIHTFTSDGTFTTDGEITSAQMLVIAGGGGGGGAGYGAGGGAGGVAYSAGVTIPAASYTADVGPGGAAGAPPNGRGTSGTDSTFGTAFTPTYRIAKGGGGSGKYGTPAPSGNGLDGGSGGGAAATPGLNGGAALQPSQNPGVPVTNSGFRGGDYNQSGGGYAPCGGGGAGGAGVDTPGPGQGGTAGGVGIEYSISGTPVYYAGGGGASIYNYPGSRGIGAGGNGGGGNGGNAHNGLNGSSPGINGVDGLGGGGGGAHGGAGPHQNSTTNGGSGGKGIIIISYPTLANPVV